MKKIEQILEFDKIKNQILKYNINSLSRKRVENLKPSFIKEIVLEELQKTKEGFELKTLGTLPNLSQLSDISDSVSILSKNGLLSFKQIYEFLNHFEIIYELKSFLKNKKVEHIYFDNYVRNLFYATEVVEKIKHCISPDLNLYDHASSELKTIRKNIKKCEESIKDKLNAFIKNNSDMLTDAFIASRNNHLVLPVKASYKNSIKGVVVDVSDTAQTYFVEPYSVVEVNIQLESLRYEEQIEERRILKAICLIIAKYLEQLQTNNYLLEEISFMYLKGSYGILKNYEIANINDSYIELIKAKHPLIDENKVISNDYILGKDNKNILVISGPNAGGKTVSLKTVALLVYMNQCGLPLPVHEASLKVFTKMFVDIGDDQSIEESLSGFTSHIANISKIIDLVDDKSLVILDELGSKTDPKEGEALAKAILDYIDDKKAIALVTTHYVGIKDFAKESSTITLASMSFNEENMEPTYKLLLNMVGRSYAFEISRRLGLSNEILKKAKSYKDDATTSLEQLIDSLNEKLKQEEIKVNELQAKQQEVERLKEELVQQQEQLTKQQEKILADFTRQQEELLEKTQIEVEALLSDLESKNKEDFKLHHKTNALQKLRQLQREEQNIPYTNNQQLSIDDDVYIESIHNYGKIKEVKNQYVIVVTNNTSLKLKKDDVKKVKLETKKTEKVRVNKLSNSTKNVSTSLNVVGYHVDEALESVDRYLDDALVVNYKTVTIIHGVGTGVLKKTIHQHLKSKKYIEEFRSGVYGEGGLGVTIITLKKG